jgi:hypothetical protein
MDMASSPSLTSFDSCRYFSRSFYLVDIFSGLKYSQVGVASDLHQLSCLMIIPSVVQKFSEFSHPIHALLEPFLISCG